jgi:subtilisin family serine protease
MKKLAPLAAAVLALTAAHVHAGAVRKTKEPIAGHYIVVFKDDVMQAAGVSAETAADRHAASYGGKRHHVYQHALHGYSAEMTAAQAERVADDPMVAFVEEDGVVHADATQSGATWGIDRLDQRDRPLSGTYTYNFDGSGVHAYVIDTGIRATHTQFAGRVGNGFTAISDGNGTNDCAGHGTHVSGTIGGSTYGVAKRVTLHPVRVLGCDGSGSNSGVVAGIDWVRANHLNPAVANMSLGGGASSATDTAVANATAAGVTMVVAAGNSNADACTTSPARAPSAITVGSTTSGDVRSSFSNWGTCVDIFAPGSSITSSWNTSDTATNTISGTSMATPHVVGVVALYLQQHGTTSVSTVTSALKSAASVNKVTSIGTGSPNLLAYSLFPSTATPTPTPAPRPTATPTPISGAAKLPVPASAVSASTNDGNVPANTVDANLSTRWSANGDGQWIQYDLGATKLVQSVKLAWYNGTSRRSTFDVLVSGSSTGPWTTAASGRQSSGTTNALESYDVTDVSGRYVRIVGHGNTVNAWNSVTETEIWGH